MNTEDTEVAQRDTEPVCEVRSGVEEDLPAILAIERRSETAPHWTEEEYRRIVRGDGTVKRCLLVAEADGRVAGFAVGMVAAGAGELESVAVERWARRQGIGRRLCRAVLEFCRSEGAMAMELEVRAGSVAARKLYENLGMKPVGRRGGYYSSPTDDAVLMRIEWE